MTRYSPVGPRSALPFLVVVAVLLSGCASIDPKPFAQFSTSLQELRKGADDALRVTTEQNKQGFIARVVAETGQRDQSTLTDALMLEPVAPFGWSYEGDEAPLYVESRRFRAGVQSLNDALVRYAGLLVQLASPELVDEEQFDGMAKDLNENLKAAGNQMGIQGADDGFALFSVAASAAAHAYIEGQRKCQLLDLLDETQDSLSGVAIHLVAAVRIASRNHVKHYQDRSDELANAITAAIPEPEGRDTAALQEKRRKHIVALMTLNDEYTGRLSALERLSHAYGSLPAAQSELRNAIEKPGYNLATVKDLYATGKELRALYKELAPDDEKIVKSP